MYDLNYYIFEDLPLLVSNRSATNSFSALLPKLWSGRNPVAGDYRQVIRDPWQRWVAGAYHFRKPDTDVTNLIEQGIDKKMVKILRRATLSPAWFEHFYNEITLPVHGGIVDDHYQSAWANAQNCGADPDRCIEVIPLRLASDRVPGLGVLNVGTYEGKDPREWQYLARAQRPKLLALWAWDHVQYRSAGGYGPGLL